MTPATPTAQVDRRVIGAPASLTFTPCDDSQGTELTLAAEPAPTVSVIDGAGEEVHAGAATISADEHSLSATIPSDDLPELDAYLVRWSATAAGVPYVWTTSLEICGGHLFTLAAMRASRSEFASLPAEQLLAARTLAEARFAVAHAEAGFTANVPLSALETDGALLATHADGEPLTPEHGWPLRLIVPGWYFWKSAKWLRGLELRPDDRPGFLERYGYHNDADPWQEQRYAFP